MADQVMNLPERTKIQILAPVVRGKKGQHKQVIAKAKREGYVRVQIDGTTYNVDDEINLNKIRSMMLRLLLTV